MLLNVFKLVCNTYKHMFTFYIKIGVCSRCFTAIFFSQIHYEKNHTELVFSVFVLTKI